MGEIINFPATNTPQFGAIHTKMMNVRCKSCGNTDRFYGKAMTHPFLIIEKQGEQHYDVTEIGYRNNGSVEELIEACASCGSSDIEIQVIKKDIQ